MSAVLNVLFVLFFAILLRSHSGSDSNSLKAQVDGLFSGRNNPGDFITLYGRLVSTGPFRLHKYDAVKEVREYGAKIGQLVDDMKTALHNAVAWTEEEVSKYAWNPNLTKIHVNYTNLRPVNDEKLSGLVPDPRYPFKILPAKSGVHVPVEVDAGGPSVFHTLRWTQALDHVFNNTEGLHHIYFASVTGVFRVYSAFQWDQVTTDMFDIRQRPWFIQGSTVPKDLLIMLDTSGSMTGQSLRLANVSAQKLISILDENDYFAVTHFPDPERRTPLGIVTGNMSRPLCFQSFVRASKRNKMQMFRELWNLTARGYARFDQSFNKALDLFEAFNNGSRIDRTGTLCNQVLVVITDNAFEFDQSVLEVLKRKPSHIRVLIYSLGEPISKITEYEKKACHYRGHYKYLPTVGAVSNMIKGAGLMVSLSMPVYNKTKESQFIGLMGTDLPIERIIAELPYLKLGPLGYAFALSPKGHVLFHPGLKLQVRDIEDPPRLDLLDVEFNTNGKKTNMRMQIIDNENGEATIDELIRVPDMIHTYMAPRRYVYSRIPHTKFGVAFVTPTYHHVYLGPSQTPQLTVRKDEDGSFTVGNVRLENMLKNAHILLPTKMIARELTAIDTFRAKSFINVSEATTKLLTAPVPKPIRVKGKEDETFDDPFFGWFGKILTKREAPMSDVDLSSDQSMDVDQSTSTNCSESTGCDNLDNTAGNETEPVAVSVPGKELPLIPKEEGKIKSQKARVSNLMEAFKATHAANGSSRWDDLQVEEFLTMVTELDGEMPMEITQILFDLTAVEQDLTERGTMPHPDSPVRSRTILLNSGVAWTVPADAKEHFDSDLIKNPFSSIMERVYDSQKLIFWVPIHYGEPDLGPINKTSSTDTNQTSPTDQPVEQENVTEALVVGTSEQPVSERYQDVSTGDPADKVEQEPDVEVSNTTTSTDANNSDSMDEPVEGLNVTDSDALGSSEQPVSDDYEGVGTMEPANKLDREPDVEFPNTNSSMDGNSTDTMNETDSLTMGSSEESISDVPREVRTVYPEGELDQEPDIEFLNTTSSVDANNTDPMDEPVEGLNVTDSFAIGSNEELASDDYDEFGEVKPADELNEESNLELSNTNSSADVKLTDVTDEPMEGLNVTDSLEMGTSEETVSDKYSEEVTLQPENEPDQESNLEKMTNKNSMDANFTAPYNETMNYLNMTDSLTTDTSEDPILENDKDVEKVELEDQANQSSINDSLQLNTTEPSTSNNTANPSTEEIPDFENVDNGTSENITNTSVYTDNTESGDLSPVQVRKKRQAPENELNRNDAETPMGFERQETIQPDNFSSVENVTTADEVTEDTLSNTLIPNSLDSTPDTPVPSSSSLLEPQLPPLSENETTTYDTETPIEFEEDETIQPTNSSSVENVTTADEDTLDSTPVTPASSSSSSLEPQSSPTMTTLNDTETETFIEDASEMTPMNETSDTPITSPSIDFLDSSSSTTAKTTSSISTTTTITTTISSSTTSQVTEETIPITSESVLTSTDLIMDNSTGGTENTSQPVFYPLPVTVFRSLTIPEVPEPYKIGVMGITLQPDFLPSQLRKMSECSEQAGKICYLIEDAAYVVAVSEDSLNSHVGRFLGYMDPPLMRTLLENKIYDVVKDYDFQAICKPTEDSDKETSGTSMLKPSLRTIGENSLALIILSQWCTRESDGSVIWSHAIPLGLLYTLGHQWIEATTRREPYFCIQLIQRYYVPSPITTSGNASKTTEAPIVSTAGTINCSDTCQRKWSVRDLDGTNLKLVMADKRCDTCGGLDEKLPRDPIEDSGPDVCEQAAHPRYRRILDRCPEDPHDHELKACHTVSLRPWLSVTVLFTLAVGIISFI